MISTKIHNCQHDVWCDSESEDTERGTAQWVVILVIEDNQKCKCSECEWRSYGCLEQRWAPLTFMSCGCRLDSSSVIEVDDVVLILLMFLDTDSTSIWSDLTWNTGCARKNNSNSCQKSSSSSCDYFGGGGFSHCLEAHGYFLDQADWSRSWSAGSIATWRAANERVKSCSDKLIQACQKCVRQKCRAESLLFKYVSTLI